MDETDCLRSARMASYMQAACSLAVKQGNSILELNEKYGNTTPESKVSLHLAICPSPPVCPQSSPHFPLTPATSSIIMRRDTRYRFCSLSVC